MKSPLGITTPGLAACAVALAFQTTDAGAAEPGWASQVLVSPPVREQVDATPIPLRPYRPFHFYGNTVRRIHYRGTPIPSASDLWQAARVLTRQPYVPVESLLPKTDVEATGSPTAAGSAGTSGPTDAPRPAVASGATAPVPPPEPAPLPDTTTRSVGLPEGTESTLRTTP